MGANNRLPEYGMKFGSIEHASSSYQKHRSVKVKGSERHMGHGDWGWW